MTLPPVKELAIRDLLGRDFFRICDWSNVTHLELVNVSNVAIIEEIPPEELSRLMTLIIAMPGSCREAESATKTERLSVHVVGPHQRSQKACFEVWSLRLAPESP